MSPTRLLQYFEQISEASDMVPRLQRFILDLAVRGKLVEQDPADEPASELLKRIRVKKQGLTGRSDGAEESPLAVAKAETPFEIPETWEWVQSTEPAVLISDHGKKVQTKDVLESGAFPVVDQGKVFIRGYCNDAKRVLRVDEPIIVFGDHTRETKLIDFDFVVGADGVKLLKPIELDPAYYFLALQWVPLDSRGYSRHFKLLRASAFPLPPLAEQHRIVAKVDELMARCDELDAAQAKRERRRDRLVTATLHGLNNGDARADPGTRPPFQDNARFYFNHLPRLTTRPEHIHQLRQTILNLAVRGKLVPQSPDDEPGSILLADIARGRERIIKALGLRQQPVLPETRHRLPPFEAPVCWIWSVVDDCFVVTGGIQKTPRRTPRNNAFPYVGVANVYRGRLDLTEVKRFELGEGELERLRLEENDLLIVEGNGSASEIGRCARWTGKILNCVHQNHIIRCRPGNSAISRFAELYLNSRVGVEVMQALAVTSAGLYNLSVGKIRQIQLPLPPLAEQHRILAKVGELMAVCDELEFDLTTAATTRRQFLEATLNEALEVGS